jgi:signal transduction histidine kinase
MRHTRTIRLTTRLQLSFLFIALASIGLTDWQSYQSARAAFEQVSFDRLTAVREAKRQQVEFFFDRVRSDLAGFTATIARNRGAERAHPAEWTDPSIRSHASSLLRFPGYEDVLIVDVRDRRIAFAGRNTDDARALRASRPGPRLDAIIDEAARADSGAVAFADFAAFPPADGAPMAFAACPVPHDGPTRFVALLRLSIGRLNALMTDNSEWARSGMGASGETYIVGPDQRMRNDSRFFIQDREAFFRMLERRGADRRSTAAMRARGTSVLQQAVRTEAARAALAGRTGVMIMEDYRGVPVLSAFAPLRLHGLRWVLLSEIDQIEALAPVYRLREQLILAALVLALGAVALGLFIARAVARPILALAEATEAFGTGDMTRRARVTSDDEIGLLARTFNTMAEKITTATAELRALSMHLQNVREDERKSLAREIHDELGQNLTALKLDLSLLRDDLLAAPHSAPATAQIARMDTHINETIQSVKRIITELRPGMLDDLGLAAAIEWLAEDFQRRTGIRTALSMLPAEFTLDQPRSTALFRILQEALTNVARHAEAGAVSITLQHDAGAVHLRVQDDGCGIDAHAATDPGSFGLIGIRERARYFNGTADIQGGTGGGTTVSVLLPDPSSEAAHD